MSAPKRVPLNCQRCGRFVRREDGHVVFDDYAGGWEADPYCGPGRGCARVLGDHDRLVTAARLLSGATTEGQRCPECGGYGWIAEPHPSTGEPINPQQCPTCRGDGLLSGGATEGRTCWPEEGT